MKKLISLAAASALVFGLMSCDNDNIITCGPNGNPDDDVKKDSLSIQTEIQTRSAISVFPENSAMGLFVTTGTISRDYNDLKSNANVKTVFDGTNWKQSQAVLLDFSPATIFAYYPFDRSNTDGGAIPVEHDSQTDYMFGTHTPGQESITCDNSRVCLKMQHALSLIQFKFSKENYSGEGKLSRIEIKNAEGKKNLSSKGEMDVESGIIAPQDGENQSAIIEGTADSPLLTIPFVASNNEECYPKVMVLPATSTATGDIIIEFTIDNKIYTYPVPANTLWEGGHKSTYTITLKSTSLVVGCVTIVDWQEGDKGNVDLED